jgi:Flp pilus assembly pilin Flp
MRAVSAVVGETGGNSGVEYALLAALIAAAVIPTVPKVGNNLHTVLSSVENALRRKTLIYVCDEAALASRRDGNGLPACCDVWKPQLVACSDPKIPQRRLP